MKPIAKPRVLLATIGSLGDLHPFIALGTALAARGAGVVLAAAAEYRSKVERAGLAFAPMRPSFADLECDLGMNLEELTRAVLARNDFLLRRLLMPSLRASHMDVMRILPGTDLLLASSLAFGARLAAERLGIRWLAVVLQPMLMLSAHDPPEIPGAAWLSRLMRRLGPRPTRWMLAALKRALTPQLRPVHALRRELGLPPTRRNPLFEGQYSPAGALGLYSPLLGAPQVDHPPGTVIVGFTGFDSDDGGPPALDQALLAFLDRGPAPLVFTLGSLIVHSPGGFYRESVRAARLLGCRAVLLVGDGPGPGEVAAGPLDAPGSADVLVCRYAAHSLLFSRAAVVIHQGGVGTLAQAMRSGRPQLIVPFYGDQADNAARAVSLGIARRLAPARYDGRAASRELAALLGEPEIALRAADVARRVLAEDGAARGAAVALELLRHRESA